MKSRNDGVEACLTSFSPLSLIRATALTDLEVDVSGNKVVFLGMQSPLAAETYTPGTAGDLCLR